MIDLESLVIFDHWQRDLATRVRRRHMVFELIDAGIETDDLALELEQLKRVRRCLRWLEKLDDAVAEKAEAAA